MLWPGLAAAQSHLSNLSGVNRAAGQLIYIEDRSLHETSMRCVRATDLELTATDAGRERRIAVSDIRRVTARGDSVRSGALLGGLVGIVPGYLGCQGASGRCSVTASTVASVGLFGALGAWIDSRHTGRTLLYEAPTPRSPRER
jgi:VIT1/CCC1 family predicted Fe2+/Mn2+ transporter